ncbi:zinc ABC transporter substrate-binding protein [Profundibacterium mesophilum]|uniref:High-affinity zinc uptake system protein ZnuA n=1 Tax=Profundibacterium mesophilum KAUST100406-0324 TaxID=1037889 RepID=A0A921P1K2_9RHOB|nr:zinc ABC transporter substrate-binding protein [Profundibacterium mesophilum]KAF0677528.1 ABC zinc transporter periplasmic binding protein ZnuA [Profundibacterium mesophilum KAUST100406-0324]
MTDHASLAAPHRAAAALKRPLRAILLPLLAASIPTAVFAAPRIVADIAPLHSIAAAVAEGVSDPSLLVGDDASAHSFALRPSQAAALQEADLVVWAGPALNPALEGPIVSLAAGAEVMSLLDVPGTHLLAAREESLPSSQEDEDGHGSDDGHGHDHGHSDENGLGIDPHAWLDPRNAVIWGRALAGALSRIDPENAERYAANAERLAGTLTALDDEIAARLAPLAARPLLVGHDAWQYVERRYALDVVGAVTLSDARDPGPARLAALRDMAQQRAPVCVLDEPGRTRASWEVILDRREVREVTIDPAGAGREPGPALYADLLRELSVKLADCLAPG